MPKCMPTDPMPRPKGSMIKEPLLRSTQWLQKVYRRIIFNQSICVLCGMRLCTSDQSAEDSSAKTHALPKGIDPDMINLCQNCRHWITPISGPACSLCTLPTEHSAQFCGQCLAKRPHFDQVVAGCLYQGPVTGLMQACKSGQKQAFVPLLQALRQALFVHFQPIAQVQLSTNPALLKDQHTLEKSAPLALFPVPTTWKRWLQRGFNPTHELAWQLSHTLLHPLKIPHQIHWQALKATSSKGTSKRQSRQQRHQSALAHFYLKDRIALKGQTAVIIDDVMTTGATANQCARLLKSQGAARVILWVCCRTPQKP